VTAPRTEVVLVRHGETDWSRSGRHTGLTDIALNAGGRAEAEAVGTRLRGRRFVLVLTSPSARAVETCRLAGFGEGAQESSDLVEWDYGSYEGLTTGEIQAVRPSWTLWRDGVPGGESLEEVAARTDRVIAKLRAAHGAVLVFAHGHVLRVLTARWLGLPPAAGRLFALDPASLSTLGYEHEAAVIQLWNERAAARAG
jgi:broad specificity phosphatase PhoE